MSQAIATTHRGSASKSRATSAIHARLRRYQVVRTRYHALLGTATAFIIGLSFVWLVVLLDSAGLLSEPLRWAVILFGYGVTAVASWCNGMGRAIRSLLFQPTSEDLARAVEAHCPSFRESLLASVELRNQDGSTKSGSETFLQRLEHETAIELNRISISELFPWDRLRNTLIAVAIGLTTMLAMCLVPSLRFPERLQRALLPLVDLPPISIWRIEVLTPSNPIEQAPSEQYVQYSVKIASHLTNSRLPQDVALEWMEQSEQEAGGWSPPNRVPMTIENDREQTYSVTAPVGNRKLRYRIFAADSRTTYRYIEPVERPQVVDYRWHVTPPAYAQSPDKSESIITQVQTEGDLAVLQGSALKLDVSVNQSMQRASLYWESESGTTTTIPFQPTPEPLRKAGTVEVWSAEIPFLENGRFQVHLVSNSSIQDKPLENSFRPWHNLTWLPDVPPSVEWAVNDKTLWQEPIRPISTTSLSRSANKTFKKSTYWMISNSEIVELACQTYDDYPIASLEFEIAINERPWESLHRVNSPASNDITVAGKKRSTSRHQLEWDLLPYRLKPGDTVQIRAVAIDRMNQRGESESLSFSIAESDFPSNRHAQLLLRRQLASPLRELNMAWNANRDAIQESLKVFAELDTDDEIRKANLQAVQEWLANIEDKRTTVEQVGLAVLPQLTAYIDQHDVELILNEAKRLDPEFLAKLRVLLTSLQSEDQANAERNSSEMTSQTRERLKQEAIDTLQRGGDLVKDFQEFHRGSLGLGLMCAVTKDAAHIMQRQIEGLKTTDSSLKSLARSQFLNSQIEESILELVSLMRDDIPSGLSERFDEWCRWLAESRGRIVDCIDLDEPEQTAKELKQLVVSDIREWGYRHWLLHLDGNLYWATESRRKDLRNRSDTTDALLNRLLELSGELERLASNKELSTSELGRQRRLLQTERTTLAAQVVDKLKAQRELHLNRTIQDPSYPSDMGLASRALEQLFELTESTNQNSSPQKLSESNLKIVRNAIRVLDAAHLSNDARVGLERLTEADRFDFASMNSRLDLNLHWSAVAHQLENAHQRMKRAQFPDGLHDSYNGLRWAPSFSNANEKFSSRMDTNRTERFSASPDLDNVVDDWKALDRLAGPFIEEARNALRKLTPSVSVLAQTAAEKTRQLEARTRELLESTTDESPPENSQESKSTEQNQQSVAQAEQQLAKATKRLQDALADEASRQDLLDRAAREQARDSDAALGMIDRGKKELDRAMQSLLDADSPDQESIANALEAEKRMETTFEAIQERFNELARSQNFSQQNPLSAPPDANLESGYEQAEQLAALSTADQEDLLRQLEQELRTNPTMQEELMAIVDTQQKSVSGELQALGKAEENTALELERSDPNLRERKRQQALELRIMADYINGFGIQKLQHAIRAAGSQNRGDGFWNEKLTSTMDPMRITLERAANQARYIDENTDSRKLAEARQILESALQEGVKEIQELLEASKSDADASAAPARRARDTAKLVEDLQRNFQRESKNSASQLERNWNEELKRQGQRYEQAAKDLQRSQESRARAQQNANRKPDDSWAQDELRRKTIEVDRKAKSLEAMKSTMEQIAATASELSAKAESLDESPFTPTSIDINPTAGLITDQLKRAQEFLNSVAEMSAKEASSEWAPPQAQQDALSAATERQTQINQAVDRIQDELRRNARHQERMQQSASSDALQNYQRQLEELRESTLAPLESQLSEAASRAESSEKDFSQANQNRELTEPLTRPTVQAEIATLGQAAEQLQSLGRSIENDPSIQSESSSSQQSEAGNTPSTTNRSESRSDILRSRDRAQLLDRMDRMMFSSSSNSSPSGMNSPSDSMQSSLRSAANELSSRMSQQRNRQMKATGQNQSSSQQSVAGQSSRASSVSGQTTADQRTGFDAYFMPDRDSDTRSEWGKLRKQAAEQNLEGSREVFDPDFDQAIQAYFRSLQTEGSK